MAHLNICPQNVIFSKKDGYVLCDPIFNRVVLEGKRIELENLNNQDLELFPELDSKFEHTVAILDDDEETRAAVMNFLIKTRKLKIGRKEKIEWSPYISPELLAAPFMPYDYSELNSKSDSFSLAMLLLKLLCSVHKENFSLYENLNKSNSKLQHNQKLAEIISQLESWGYKKLCELFVKLAQFDPLDRIGSDKALDTLHESILKLKDVKKGDLVLRSYAPKHKLAPESGYLKTVFSFINFL